MEFSNMFTLTPMSQKINLVAGGVYNGYVTVANPASATNDFKYKVDVSGYAVSGEEYHADFEIENNYTMMKDWITIENPTGSLKPNETAKIKYTITVPENAPAGGQYASLMIGSDDSAQSSDTVTVNNVYEMASIIYANVAGETTRSGELVENSFPGFVTSLPITTNIVFKNDGNVHEAAQISIEIRDFFTNNVVFPTDDEKDVIEEIVMPGTTREMSRLVDGISPLGVFEMKQTITYMGHSYVEEHTIFLFPIWFMAIIAVFVCLILGFIVRIIIKRRQRKIIA